MLIWQQKITQKIQYSRDSPALLSTGMVIAYGFGPGFHFGCFGLPVHLPEQGCVVFQASGYAWVIRAKGRLSDGQRSLMERLCICVFALVVIEIRQIVEASGHVRVIRAKGLFLDGQRSLIERLCFLVLALVFIE